jgi:hypothetical protein
VNSKDYQGKTKSAPGGSRTPNQRIRSPPLYPLSYGRAVILFRQGHIIPYKGDILPYKLPVFEEEICIMSCIRYINDRMGSPRTSGERAMCDLGEPMTIYVDEYRKERSA